MKTQRFLHAYTLIEVLLTVSLLVLLVGISIPVYQNFQIINELDSAVNLTVRSLRSAQIQSQAVQQDSQWGVYFVANNIVIYKGATYATRDTSFDQSYSVPVNVSISGANDIVYSKVFGDPSTTGTITFSNFNRSKNITINSKGALTY